jgi:hypothetical protein
MNIPIFSHLASPKKAFEDGQKLLLPVGKSASIMRKREIGNRMIIEVGIKFTLLKEEGVEGWWKMHSHLSGSRKKGGPDLAL